MVPLTEGLLPLTTLPARFRYFCHFRQTGSINHTLLASEAIQKRGIVLDTVLYNLSSHVEDKTIQEDTMNFIRQWLKKYFPQTQFMVVPEIQLPAKAQKES